MAYFNELWQESKLSKMTKRLLKAYENSQVKIIMTTLVKWHGESFIYHKWQGYIKRQSSIKYSVTYRLISHIAKYLDGQIDRMHWRGKRAIFSSFSHKLVRNFIKEREENQGKLIALAAAGFVIGYSVVAFLTGKGFLNNGLSMVLGIVLIGAILSIKEQWKLWYSDSVMYKLYRYIFY